MLVPYGYHELEKRLFFELFDALSVLQCRYSALKLMHDLTYRNYSDFEIIIGKAKNVCLSLNIPLQYHFKQIYICSDAGISVDYRLSKFACYLITINADSSYPAVARAQVYLAARYKH